MYNPAFFSYLFVSCFTPGPNNIMSMSTSLKHGLKRALVFALGAATGFVIVLSICAVFTTLLFEYIPSIEPVIKFIGAAYLIYLAYRTVADRPAKNTEDKSLSSNTFMTAIILQFINVKGFIFSITALSTFILPVSSSKVFLFISVTIMGLTVLTSITSWGLFGALFQKFFDAHRKLANGIMAALLIYCAFMMIK